MASSKGNRGSTKSRGSSPISAHPAFPAIVALWFSALLGLGSLVLPASLPDRIVELTGLAALLPVLEPPLGIAARAVIALAMTVAGAALGLAVARRIAAVQDTPRPARRNRARVERENEAPGRRPISALEELGDDLERFTNDTHAREQRDQNAGVRRRALSMVDERNDRPWVPDVPLPGADLGGCEQPLSLANTIPVAEPGPLELAPFAHIANEPKPELAWFAPTTDAPSATAQSEPPAPTFATSSPAPFSQPAVPDPGEPLAPPSPPSPMTPPMPQSTDVACRPLAELGVVELIERLALAMHNRQAHPAGRRDADDRVDNRHDMAKQAAQALARFPIADNEADHARPSRSPRPDEPPFPTIPPALRPMVFDRLDDEDTPVELPSFALRHEDSMRDAVPFAAPAPGFGPPVDEEEPDEEESDDKDAIDEADGYSSLLKLKSSAARPPEFVRIEEPEPDNLTIQPVVVFPGHESRRADHQAQPEQRPQFGANVADDAGSSSLRPFDSPGTCEVSVSGPAVISAPVDPGETERALRAALANLQRIGGAG